MSETERRHIAGAAAQLAAQLGRGRHDEYDCDVLIIGTGYGGAIAAQLMGESKKFQSVWMVERGREYLPGDFPADFSMLPGHVRFSRQDGRAAKGNLTALLDLRLGDHVNALLGNGLGGGSLINAGVMARASSGVLGDPVWPSELNSDWEAAYQVAEAMLKAGAVGEHAKSKALDVLLGGQQGQQSATNTVTVCHATIQTSAPDGSGDRIWRQCTACGDCLTGCNVGAKKSLDTTALRAAYEAGVNVYCGVSVVRVEPPLVPDAPWRVHWQFTQPDLRPVDGPDFVIRARHVILAAGTFASTEILLRSSGPDFALSDRLGSSFSTNGDQIAAVLFPNDLSSPNSMRDPPTSNPGNPSDVGPTITRRAALPLQSGPGTIEEFAVPAALAWPTAEIVATFAPLGAKDRSDPSFDPQAASPTPVRRTLVLGMMGNDGAKGTLRLVGDPTSGTGKSLAVDAQVRVEWPNVGHSDVFLEQHRWLLKAAAHARPDIGKSQVIPNPMWYSFRELVGSSPEREVPEPDELKKLVSTGGLTTVHPLGGCPMGKDAGSGVVDWCGRLFRPKDLSGKAVYPRIAVLDGSVVPRALGINPALTIAAISARATEKLIEEWALNPVTAAPERVLAARVAQPPGPIPGPETEPRPTRVRLSEVMHGAITLNGTSYWARLKLNNAEIHDLMAFVRADPGHARGKAGMVFQFESGQIDLWEGGSYDEWEPPTADPTMSRPLKSAQLRALAFAAGTTTPRELRYDLEVDPGQGDNFPMQSLVGRKELSANGLKGRRPSQIFRMLTELELSLPVDASRARSERLGYLTLDLDDLADRETPLLDLVARHDAPRSFADLLSLGMLVARSALQMDASRFAVAPDFPDPWIIRNLNARWPGPLAMGAQRPRVYKVGAHGARLSRYLASEAIEPESLPKRPVMLIHGYGASGTTFTHSAIPTSMTQHLCATGHDVWVLDLRSSIANEPADPDAGRAGPFTFEEIALGDIPAALQCIRESHESADATSTPKVDVVAHCIGAAMFCAAMLLHGEAHHWVGKVVLSQVTPYVRLSPWNRLRGLVGRYIESMLGVEEFDTRPEFKRQRTQSGEIEWVRDPVATERMTALDTLLTQFPYPQDDGGLEMAAGSGIPFEVIRRRADAIFGQLMELSRMSPQTMAHLEAINGWVKVQSFAQAVHWARMGILADRSGFSSAYAPGLVTERLGFPLLMLQGRKNRVFHWSGGLQTYEQLGRLRGLGTIGPLTPTDRLGPTASVRQWGSASSGLQLNVYRDYGHQDCLIGKDVADDIFGDVVEFLASAVPNRAKPTASPTLRLSAPWIGPVCGAVRGAPSKKVEVPIVAHPNPKEPVTLGWLVRTPSGDRAFWVRPKEAGSAGDATQAMLLHALTLQHDPTAGKPAFQWEIWMLHEAPWAFLDDVRSPNPEPPCDRARYLVHELDEGQHRALNETLPPAKAAPPYPNCVYLDGHTLAAASHKDPCGAQAHEVSFVVASCQYPEMLIDKGAAQASYRRLADALPGAEPARGQCEGEGQGTPLPLPQFLLLLGDQVYVDADGGLGVAESYPGSAGDAVRSAYERNWRLPAFQEVARKLPIMTMLDDHEVQDNWQPLHGHAERRSVQAGIQGFLRYQAPLNPKGLIPLGHRSAGNHYAFWSGGALFIVLDTRSQREMRRLSVGQAGTNLNRAQILPRDVLDGVQALLKKAAPACFKFIATSAPLFPLPSGIQAMFQRDPTGRDADSLAELDGWAGYPRSMVDLLQVLASECVHGEPLKNVVLLSGDAHLSSFTRATVGEADLVSIVSSALHAPWPFANSLPSEFWEGGSVKLGSKTHKVSVSQEKPQFAPGDGYMQIRVSNSKLQLWHVPASGGPPLQF